MMSLRLLSRAARAVAAPAQRCVAARSFGATAAAGENVALNWSLVDDDITPMNNAYRNLGTRGLMQRAAGSHGPNKSLAVPARADPAGPADADAVARALSHVDDVFVVDAAVGSFRGSELLVRAVTDDAAVALFLRHLLVRTGGASSAETGSAHPVKVFHSSKIGTPGLSSTVGELGATIVATGDVGFEHLQEAITAATHALMATGEDEYEVLPLPGAAYVDAAGKTTVQIDVASPGKTAAPAKNSSLYGAHGVVWSASGLARLFRGAVVDGKTATALGAPRAGDVVVGETAVVTSFDADNLAAHPSEIVFVGGKGKGKKADKPEDLFAGVARLDSEVAKFAAYVKKHKVKVTSK